MSKIEVNTVDVQCGSTLTLGSSGKTVTLATGASQSGFGRTGTVDWVTSIQTGTVTAATGKGYFVNTTSGGITVNLPAGAVGSIVAVSDYASTSASNNITITPNGSDKINGVNDDYTINTAGLAVTLVYADAARGWKSVTGSDADATGVLPAFVAATGGTITTVCTNYKVHTFTGDGTFTVSDAGNAAGSNAVDYLVIAGAGGGGANGGGGGGAGGYREATTTYSPVPALASTSQLAVTATGYPIVVGAGGSPGSYPTAATSGAASSFSTITSAGGGFGITNNSPPWSGGTGGSGGGSRAVTPASAGNTPPVSPPQGNAGGAGLIAACVASGGGGAGGAGGNTPTVPGNGPTQIGGTGGIGLASSITGSPVTRASGATGGGCKGSPGVTWPSPPGGAGAGGTGPTPSGAGGVAGTANTGGGGGGGGNYGPVNSGGTGGSGVVIIRYKFQ